MSGRPVPERVFVVDDEDSIRKALWRLLRSAGFEVAAFASAAEFLRVLDADPAGCAVLDVSMPGLDGLSLQEMLAARGCELPVLFLTGHGDIPKSVRAMRGGAVDFLEKPVDEAVLLAAVRRAIERDRAGRAARLQLADARERLATLSPREREVLQGVVAGSLNKQIAGQLGISEKTVKVHRGRVMEKMGVASVAELARLADHLGIALPADAAGSDRKRTEPTP
jgi:FixJ family two-component response regulator